MGLNSDKTSKVFCINICCFSTNFYFSLYHSGTVIQVSSKLWLFLISTPHKTKTFTMQLAVTTNTKETVLKQRCCLEATIQESSQYHKRSYSISNIGNMMGCNHPSCVPVGPLAGELWHFEYFPTTTVRHFEF